jgi:sterol-4alpha-carboxylate 3-dehydrogenase (decarboxylating)
MAEPLRRLAITGGCGFLGRRLAALAAPHFEEVRVVDIVPWPDDVERPPNLRYFEADITRPGTLDPAFDGVDTVFHSAAVVDVRPRRNPLMEAVNVDGTRHVIDTCQRLGVRRLLHTSTMDVVFDGRPKKNADESEPYPTRPANGYIRTKVEAEKLALAANNPSKLSVVSLRPTGIYGPHDRHRLGALTASVRSGELSIRFGDGTAHFDHVYVDNVAHAHVLAARELAAEPNSIAGRAYFVGDHPGGNFFEFLAPLFAAAGANLPNRHLPKVIALFAAAATEMLYRMIGPFVPSFNPQFSTYVVRTLAQDWTFSYARATRDFGYQPLVSLEEARRRTELWASTAQL